MFNQSFETIIVGVDFSTYSKIVVQQALKLSGLWKTKLILVHAFNEPLLFESTFNMPMMNPIGADYYIKKVRRFYDIPKKNVEVRAEYANPTALIRAVAKNEKSPLIMVGYRGHSALVEFLFGSTARNLALRTKTAVWIQRGDKVIEPNRVLIPHDLSVEANKSIDILKKLNLVRPLTYQVYFVLEKPFPVLDYEEYKEMEESGIQEAAMKKKKLFSLYPRLELISASGDVTEKIVQKAKKFDFILIAHHNSPSYYSTTETEQLLKKVNIPLLIV